MKRLLTTASSLLIGAFMLLNAQTPVTVSIDAEQENHQISPLIYGININQFVSEDEQMMTAFRKGGNRWTAYNWENNMSSAGSDYQFNNDEYLVTGMSNKTAPARPITNLLEETKEHKQHIMATVPLAGYVATGPTGAVTEFSYNNYSAVKLRKEGELSLSPDLTDTVIYLAEFLNYLQHFYGTANNGGPNAYSLDNEPVLWHQKHSILHPNQLTMTELMTKSVETAKLIKEFDPKAEVMGTAAFGWHGLTNLATWSSEANAPADWNQVKAQYQDTFYVAYLNKFKEASSQAGVRLLDALDLHWYPTEKVQGKLIVNLGGDNPNANSDLTSEAVVERRLQAPRSFWDKKYAPYAANIGRPAVLRRLSEAIDTIYPGTKLSVTEYKFGAEWHISGGLAVADILGIFGREKVYLAHKWDGLEAYSEAAFRLFLDYDGEGGKFGQTYAKTMVSDSTLASSYSSIDENGNLHIIYINKQDAEIATSFNVNNGYYTSAKVYGFGPENAEIEEFDEVSSINESFTYNVPAYTALHFVLESKSQGYFTNISTDLDDASLIKATVSTAASNVSETGFYVLANGSKILASSVNTKGTELEISLESAIPASASTIVFVYENGTLENRDGTPFKKAEIETPNTNKDAAPYLMGAIIPEDGKSVNLKFNQNLDQVGSFSLKANGTDIEITDSKIVDQTTLSLTLSKTVYSDQNIQLLSTDEISFIKGAPMNGITVTDFDNQATITPPTLISTNVIDYGINLELLFNKFMEITDESNIGFNIYINDSKTEYTAHAENQSVILGLESKIEYGDKISIEYADGSVQSIFGGKVTTTVLTELENNLENPPAPLQLPGRLEVEDFYYSLNYNYKESIESGTVETLVLGNFSIGSELAYRILCDKDQTYNLKFVSASSGTDSYGKVYIDDEYATDFFLPHNSGWANWVETNYPIDIPQGEHVFKIVFDNVSVNMDYFEFGTSLTTDDASVRNATIPFSGDVIKLQINRLTTAEITADDIEIKAGEQIIPISSVTTSEPGNVLKIALNGVIGKGETVTISFTSDKKTESGGNLQSEPFSVKNSSAQAETVVGLHENNLTATISPIPFNGKDFVLNSTEQIDNIAIYNIAGELVYESAIHKTHSEIELPNKLASGFYTVKICSAGKLTTIKVIAD